MRDEFIEVLQGHVHMVCRALTSDEIPEPQPAIEIKPPALEDRPPPFHMLRERIGDAVRERFSAVLQNAITKESSTRNK